MRALGPRRWGQSGSETGARHSQCTRAIRPAQSPFGMLQPMLLDASVLVNAVEVENCTPANSLPELSGLVRDELWVAYPIHRIQGSLFYMQNGPAHVGLPATVHCNQWAPLSGYPFLLVISLLPQFLCLLPWSIHRSAHIGLLCMMNQNRNKKRQRQKKKRRKTTDRATDARKKKYLKHSRFLQCHRCRRHHQHTFSFHLDHCKMRETNMWKKKRLNCSVCCV